MSQSVSIIMPAHNCCSSLKKTLAIVFEKWIKEYDLEVIVIDDNSDDNTVDFFRGINKKELIYLRYNSNRGVAITRNQGLRMASKDIIFFLDADNIPHINTLTEHMSLHKRYPELHIGILGNVCWPEDVEINALMKLDDVSQKSLGLKHLMEYDWTFFATTNVSLKRNFIDIGFSEELFAGKSGFEDTEFGFSLGRKGLKLIYNEKAISYHYHFRKPRDFLNKAYVYGTVFGQWLKTADNDFLDNKNYISRYLPWYAGKLNKRYIRYLLSSLLVNDFTFNGLYRFIEYVSKYNQVFAVFLYRRLYNYFFIKGYRKETIPKLGE